jgi:MoxR-like ATPase
VELVKITQEGIAIVLQAGHVPYIEGGPGEGKTAFIESLAKAFNAELHIEIGSIADPLDFKGQPVMVTDSNGERRLVYQTPDDWIRLNRAKHAIAFLDELPNSPGPIQAALLTVIQKRKLGSFQLGNHVWFAAAGNPIELCPNGTPLFAPMANRMVHFKWPFDVSAWRNGMLAGWPTPSVPRLPVREAGDDAYKADWRDHMVKAVALVTGFSSFRASMISNMPKGENEQAGAWPSPRSWTMLSEVLAAGLSVNAHKDVIHQMAAGCVGAGPAAEFMTWQDKLDLQDPEELLKKPKSLKLPQRGDLQFATLGAVAGAVLSNTTPGRYKQAWAVLAEAYKQQAGDVACSAAMAIAKGRKPGCQITEDAALFYPLLEAAGLLDDIRPSK